MKEIKDMCIVLGVLVCLLVCSAMVVGFIQESRMTNVEKQNRQTLRNIEDFQHSIVGEIVQFRNGSMAVVVSNINTVNGKVTLRYTSGQIKEKSIQTIATNVLYVGAVDDDRLARKFIEQFCVLTNTSLLEL